MFFYYGKLLNIFTLSLFKTLIFFGGILKMPVTFKCI